MKLVSLLKIYAHPEIKDHGKSIVPRVKLMLFYEDKGKHRKPHIHIIHRGDEIVVDLKGNTIVGRMKDKGKLKKAIEFIKNNTQHFTMLWNKAKNNIEIEDDIEKIDWN
jgi:hypothetical protein